MDSGEIKIAEIFKHKKKELFERIDKRAASSKLQKINLSNDSINNSPKQHRKMRKNISVEVNRGKISKSYERDKKLNKINEINKEVIERLKHGERINVLNNFIDS